MKTFFCWPYRIFLYNGEWGPVETPSITDVRILPNYRYHFLQIKTIKIFCFKMPCKIEKSLASHEPTIPTFPYM